MKGQTLIEVLVALAVAVVVVSAVTVVSISSLSNAQFVKDQDRALKYAQEGIEIVRKIRNSDYDGFKLHDGLYCLGSDLNLEPSTSPCTENIDNRFIRSVLIQQDQVADCGLNIAKVTVEVSHTSGRCKAGSFCHSSKLVSCFSTINPVAAP